MMFDTSKTYQEQPTDAVGTGIVDVAVAVVVVVVPPPEPPAAQRA